MNSINSNHYRIRIIICSIKSRDMIHIYVENKELPDQYVRTNLYLEITHNILITSQEQLPGSFLKGEKYICC
jgi:hypothetical protein